MTPEQEATIRTREASGFVHSQEAVTILLTALDAARAELQMCEPSDAEADAEVTRLNALLDAARAENARLREVVEFVAEWAHDCDEVVMVQFPYGFDAIENKALAVLKGT